TSSLYGSKIRYPKEGTSDGSSNPLSISSGCRVLLLRIFSCTQVWGAEPLPRGRLLAPRVTMQGGRHFTEGTGLQTWAHVAPSSGDSLQLTLPRKAHMYCRAT